MTTLIQVQSATGLVIAAFAYPHLFNTMLAGVLGEKGYEGFQLAARQVYRHPVVETLVLGSIGGHIVVTIIRKVQHKLKERRAAKANVAAADDKDKRATAVMNTPTTAQRLFEYSGYAIMLMSGTHIFATRFRYPELRVGWQGNVYLMHHMGKLFVPYYIIFGTAGVFHSLIGIKKALGHFQQGRKVRNASWFPKGTLSKVLVVGSAVALVAGVLATAGLLPWIPVDVKASAQWPYSKRSAKDMGLPSL